MGATHDAFWVVTDSNKETAVTESHDEFPDHLLPSVNTLQNIVLQKQVAVEVTPI